MFKVQNTSRTGTIADYNIAQLRLLFKFEQESHIYHLVCVQHFTILKKLDPQTGMYILERSDLYEVIPARNILRNVHLIPFFETTFSARDTLDAKTDVYSFHKYVFNHYSDMHSFLNFK